LFAEITRGFEALADERAGIIAFREPHYLSRPLLAHSLRRTRAFSKIGNRARPKQMRKRPY
jgi:hypothetical protein